MEPSIHRRPLVALVELQEQDIVAERATTVAAIARSAAMLTNGGVVALRIHPRAVEKEVAIARGNAALIAITNTMIERYGLPEDAYVEVDDESYGTPVAPFNDRRFLLPHQDGGHASFLTPSRLDSDLDPAERMFSSTVYWKRPSHKMYQGFIITSPGIPPGETYYYNILTLLSDAFIVRHGRPPSLSELAAFNLENLRRARQHQPTHGSRYVTLGALLGSSELAHHVMPSGPRAESEFWPAQYIAMPALCEMADRCPCGTCREPGMRAFCHACVHTLCRTWPEFRSEYEVTLSGERYDLMIGNNITQLHAASSSVFRTIRPMCIVVDRPEGDPYERWLGGQWRAWYGPLSLSKLLDKRYEEMCDQSGRVGDPRGGTPRRDRDRSGFRAGGFRVAPSSAVRDCPRGARPVEDL